MIKKIIIIIMADVVDLTDDNLTDANEIIDLDDDDDDDDVDEDPHSDIVCPSLALFQHEQKGWGVRTEKTIKKGRIIGFFGQELGKKAYGNILGLVHDCPSKKETNWAPNAYDLSTLIPLVLQHKTEGWCKPVDITFDKKAMIDNDHIYDKTNKRVYIKIEDNDLYFFPMCANVCVYDIHENDFQCEKDVNVVKLVKIGRCDGFDDVITPNPFQPDNLIVCLQYKDAFPAKKYKFNRFRMCVHLHYDPTYLGTIKKKYIQKVQMNKKDHPHFVKWSVKPKPRIKSKKFEAYVKKKQTQSLHELKTANGDVPMYFVNEPNTHETTNAIMPFYTDLLHTLQQERRFPRPDANCIFYDGQENLQRKENKKNKTNLCDVIRYLPIIALREIQPGEEIMWNYGRETGIPKKGKAGVKKDEKKGRHKNTDYVTFPNPSNYCFANAFIQATYHAKIFRDYVIALGDKPNDDTFKTIFGKNMDNNITPEGLKELFKRMDDDGDFMENDDYANALVCNLTQPYDDENSTKDAIQTHFDNEPIQAIEINKERIVVYFDFGYDLDLIVDRTTMIENEECTFKKKINKRDLVDFCRLGMLRKIFIEMEAKERSKCKRTFTKDKHLKNIKSLCAGIIENYEVDDGDDRIEQYDGNELFGRMGLDYHPALRMSLIKREWIRVNNTPTVVSDKTELYWKIIEKSAIVPPRKTGKKDNDQITIYSKKNYTTVDPNSLGKKYGVVQISKNNHIFTKLTETELKDGNVEQPSETWFNYIKARNDYLISYYDALKGDEDPTPTAEQAIKKYEIFEGDTQKKIDTNTEKIDKIKAKQNSSSSDSEKKKKLNTNNQELLKLLLKERKTEFGGSFIGEIGGIYESREVTNDRKWKPTQRPPKLEKLKKEKIAEVIKKWEKFKDVNIDDNVLLNPCESSEYRQNSPKKDHPKDYICKWVTEDYVQETNSPHPFYIINFRYSTENPGYKPQLNRTFLDTRYTLQSFVYQRGGAGGGHYVCYVNHNNTNTFVILNDNNRVLGPFAYVDLPYEDDNHSNCTLAIYEKAIADLSGGAKTKGAAKKKSKPKSKVNKTKGAASKKTEEEDPRGKIDANDLYHREDLLGVLPSHQTDRYIRWHRYGEPIEGMHDMLAVHTSYVLENDFVKFRDFTVRFVWREGSVKKIKGTEITIAYDNGGDALQDVRLDSKSWKALDLHIARDIDESAFILEKSDLESRCEIYEILNIKEKIYDEITQKDIKTAIHEYKDKKQFEEGIIVVDGDDNQIIVGIKGTSPMMWMFWCTFSSESYKFWKYKKIINDKVANLKTNSRYTVVFTSVADKCLDERYSRRMHNLVHTLGHLKTINCENVVRAVPKILYHPAPKPNWHPNIDLQLTADKLPEIIQDWVMKELKNTNERKQRLLALQYICDRLDILDGEVDYTTYKKAIKTYKQDNDQKNTIVYGLAYEWCIRNRFSCQSKITNIRIKKNEHAWAVKEFSHPMVFMYVEENDYHDLQDVDFHFRYPFEKTVQQMRQAERWTKPGQQFDEIKAFDEIKFSNVNILTDSSKKRANAILMESRRRNELRIELRNKPEVKNTDAYWQWKAFEQKCTAFPSFVKEVNLTYKDIFRLNRKKWLNDEIINSYLFLLQQEMGGSTHYIVNTTFYDQLMENKRLNIPKAKKFLRKALTHWKLTVKKIETKKYIAKDDEQEEYLDLLAFDKVYFPINNIRKTHWFLVELDTTETPNTFTVYDSLYSTPSKATTTREDPYINNLGLYFDLGQYELSKVTQEYAKQIDGESCGVFVCMYLTYLIREKDIPTTRPKSWKESWKEGKDDVMKWRRFICQCLVKGKIPQTLPPVDDSPPNAGGNMLYYTNLTKKKCPENSYRPTRIGCNPQSPESRKSERSVHFRPVVEEEEEEEIG